MSSITVGIDGVHKVYGTGKRAVTALSAVTLDIAAGELVAVMGPSGSGKSTLLHLMAGIDTPDRGRIFLAGQELGRLSDDARSDLRLAFVGFVFQTFHLIPSFTVVENVVWPLEFAGIGRRRAQARASAMLARVGIDAEARERRPAELSGGEQQRVALARALVTEPGLLLADEPTGNLDSRTGESILDLLDDLNRDRGLTVVLATHSTLAARHAHRTIEIADGRIVAPCEDVRRDGTTNGG